MTYKYVTDPSFRRRFKRKPPQAQAAVLRCIEDICADPHGRDGRRPRTKLLKSAGIRTFYTRIDRANRLTWRLDGSKITFRNTCGHDEVLRKK